MIRVTINGKEESIQEGLILQELLEAKDVSRASVWINGKQLLRAEYSGKVLKEGDIIKILRLVAGG